MKYIKNQNSKILYSDFRKQIVEDYKFAVYSRNIGITCKKNILKGKELVNIAIAKTLREGDNNFESYGNLVSQIINKSVSITELCNTKAISTETQMLQLLEFAKKTKNSNEKKVAYGSIRNIRTHDKSFWETISIAADLQLPMAVSVWNDGSELIEEKNQADTKKYLLESLQKLEQKINEKKLLIFNVKGWDYSGIIKIYMNRISLCRNSKVPVIFNIEEMMQLEKNSDTLKNKLEYEKEYDPITKMYDWIINNNIASIEELEEIKKRIEKEVVLN